MQALVKAALAALFVAVSALPAFAAPPPISAYGALPALEDVAISQDGSRLAYIAVTGERRTLVMQTLDGNPLGAIEVGDVKVRGVQWAGPEHVIITTSVTESVPEWSLGKEEWFHATVYNLNDRKLWNLMGHIPDTANVVNGELKVMRYKGEWVAIAATLHKFKSNTYRRIPLDGGPSTALEDLHNKTESVYIDRKDPTRFHATSRFDQQTDLWTLHVRDGAGWPVIYSVRQELDRPHLYGKGRTEDSLLLVVPGDKDDRIMEISRQGGEPRPATDDAHAYNEVLRDPVTDDMIGLGYWDDYQRYAFFDPQDQANWAKAQRVFKGQRIDLLDWSDDRRKVVVNVQGPQNSGAYYFIDFATNQVTLIGEAFPGVAPEQVADIQPYEYKAADGLVIPGYLTLPRGREPKNLPLIVFPHGGPEVHDVQSFDWWAQAMASRGYAVLQPNYRGSSGYGTEHTNAGHGQWGRKMQTDLSDGVRALAADGVIDPKRVCIVGASYGGYAAMAGPTIDPGVYRCAVAVAGVSDLPAMLLAERMDAGGKRDNGSSNYWRRFMGTEKDNDPSLIEVSPARQIARLDAPILLIHGRDDTVVPFRQSQLFMEAARKAGKPAELVELKGEDHWLSRSSTRLQMLQVSIDFLEKHNPPN